MNTAPIRLFAIEIESLSLIPLKSILWHSPATRIASD